MMIPQANKVIIINRFLPKNKKKMISKSFTRTKKSFILKSKGLAPKISLLSLILWTIKFYNKKKKIE